MSTTVWHKVEQQCWVCAVMCSQEIAAKSYTAWLSQVYDLKSMTKIQIDMMDDNQLSK